MPSGLLTLLGLHFRGKLRRALRGARTVRGLAFLILGFLMICAWLGPQVYKAVTSDRANPDVVRIIAPFAILGSCLSNLLASFGENAIAFTGAEVDFLFPGPFTRRSLLGYKILKTAVGTIFTTLIFSILLLRYGGSWLACCMGIWLTVQFMQLFAMAVMMLGQTIGQQAYSAARRVVLAVVIGVVAIALAPKLASGIHMAPVELMRQVHESFPGKVLLAPFDVLARTMTARSLYPEAMRWGSIALLMNAMMLAIVISLDANYLETAATVSQKRYERSQRVRRGGMGGMRSMGVTRFRVPLLPWLGGVGPIAWRQLTGAVRNSRSLLVVLVFVGLFGGSIILRNREASESAIGPLIGAIIWMNVVFVSMLKFDFRDELDRLDLLHSLPIRPAAVAMAELVTPVLMLTALQVLLCIVLTFVFHFPRVYLLPAIAMTIPFNLLLCGIENLLFLMFPIRAAGLIAGDMQLFGRQMIVFMCKFLLLMIGLAGAAAVGLIGYIAGNRSWIGFGIAGWIGLWLVALGTVPLLGRAFSRFDPSMDTPA